MDHILEIDEAASKYLNNELFPSIKNGNTVLFLGAGASVSNRTYLGKDIIDYYESKLGIQLNIADLVEFVDIISTNKLFSREHFDNYISEILYKLKPTDPHKVLATIGWNQIITTNLDLVIERAFDSVHNTTQQWKTLKTCRNISDLHSVVGPDHVRYIKLNGCISDKRKYPFVFSNKDFESSKRYYKQVLKSLSDLTNEVKFLSIGYSFTDGLSKYILNYFDSFSFRYKRPILCLDPFVESGKLEYLKDKGIYIVKLDTEKFFELYTQWNNNYSESISARKGISFRTVRDSIITLPQPLKLKLGNSLFQLCDDARIPSFSAKIYYEGEKPTYDVIRRNYDVVKQEKLIKVKGEIIEILNKNGFKMIPVVFLSGYFGSGKSTFLYRLIYALTHEPKLTCAAFEILQFQQLKTHDLGELFSLTDAKNIIITCQEIELDSSFKEMMDLRSRLSEDQFSEFSITFIVSIRENILQKFLRDYSYKNLVEINIDEKFNKQEATDLVDKLSDNKIITYRDSVEKQKIITKILTEYEGDSFLSLVSLVSKTSLEDVLYDAYLQLSKTAREAFMYTSLLYQYKILMPSALLMRLVSKDWKSFEDDVLRYDSKNILIQEHIDNNNTPRDVYFRTKHPLISEKIVSKILQTDDRKFDKLKDIVNQLNDSDLSAKLFVNLIKSLLYYNSLSSEKINRLYDLASSIFDLNPHFTLHYARNLQLRRDERSIRKAINKIVYVESNLERRNHRLVHRRAVLNYELGKLFFKELGFGAKVTLYIDEARELFLIKRLEDPLSSYSYVDWINLEMWVLNNINLNEKDLLLLHIRVQELFGLANRAVFENTEKIYKLKAKYLRHIGGQQNSGTKPLEAYLDELYEIEETRPYSLVLKYNLLLEKERGLEAEQLIEELELYKFNDEVSKLLFTYYGRNLHLVNNRLQFFKIVKGGYDFVNKDRLRYHFYSYIAESYNKHFSAAKNHLEEIYTLINSPNPDLHEIWLDDDLTPVEFTGVLRSSKKGYYWVKIVELQQTFPLTKINKKHFTPTILNKYVVNLHFFVKGIRAELVRPIE